MEKQIVAQIVFAPGTNISEVNEALRKLGQQIAVEGEQVQDFDPTYGGPVIYFP